MMFPSTVTTEFVPMNTGTPGIPTDLSVTVPESEYVCCVDVKLIPFAFGPTVTGVLEGLKVIPGAVAVTVYEPAERPVRM